MEVKPGYKTTEFWFTVAATIAGLITASGLFVDGPIAQAVGVVTSALSAMGYSYSRAQVKSSTLP